MLEGVLERKNGDTAKEEDQEDTAKKDAEPKEFLTKEEKKQRSHFRIRSFR